MGFSSVGIVGSGPVGCAIAIAVARTRTPATIVRAAHGDRALARRRIDARLRFFSDHGELNEHEVEAAREAIVLADDLTLLSPCDLVIESVSGDDRARRAILATLESRLSPATVLATNSPPERLAEIGEVLRRPDQFVGLHFFRSEPTSAAGTARRDGAAAEDARRSLSATRLVELGLLTETAPGVAAACRAFARSIGTTAIERSPGAAQVGYREFLSGGG